MDLEDTENSPLLDQNLEWEFFISLDELQAIMLITDPSPTWLISLL